MLMLMLILMHLQSIRGHIFACALMAIATWYAHECKVLSTLPSMAVLGA